MCSFLQFRKKITASSSAALTKLHNLESWYVNKSTVFLRGLIFTQIIKNNKD